MALTRQGYRARLIDGKIAEYLRVFGALSIEGPKWCGKTWTSLHHCNSVTYFMDPDEGARIRETALEKPSAILNGAPPQALDEWQTVPTLWDAVRHMVDLSGAPGRFVLTGSTTPLDDAKLHSGIGRIVRIRMHTMSSVEAGESSGAVSLRALLDGGKPPVEASGHSLDQAIHLAARGGWPQSLSYPEREALLVPQEYIRALADSEIVQADGIRRDPAKVRSLLQSLARNVATAVSGATLERELDKESEGLSKPSVLAYLNALRRLYVIEEIPAWGPRLKSKARTRTAPKRVFADPSLAVAAIGATPERLVHDLSFFGQVFENLCLRDLLVYANCAGAMVYHYRDDTGLEADAIVEAADGRWGAIEVKYSTRKVGEGAASLKRLDEKIVRLGGEPAAFLAVVTATGVSSVRDDNVYVVPFGVLGP